jgi:hypothetical protein
MLSDDLLMGYKGRLRVRIRLAPRRSLRFKAFSTNDRKKRARGGDCARLLGIGGTSTTAASGYLCKFIDPAPRAVKPSCK